MKEIFAKAGRALRLSAEIAAGIVGQSLVAVVQKLERTHFARNQALRDARHGAPMRLMRWMTRHIALTVVMLLAVYAGTEAVTWWQPLGGPAAPNIDDYFRDFEAVNGAVLAAQTTFIGIVFPLVIAFVGLLNQGRASFASRLTIYVEETAAIFVGASSLLLCVAIVAQMPFAGQLPVRLVAAGAVLNILWFCLNVGALAYFLLRTIDYLHPSKRAGITKSYVANVAWRNEFRDIVMQNRWLGAAHYKYLPAGRETDAFEESGARVWYSGLFDAGDPIVMRQGSRPMILRDVHFGVLAPIIRHWLADAEREAGTSGHTLVFPLHPNTEYKSPITLARATLRPGIVSRLAIAAAISLKRDRSDPAAINETSRLLKEMIADLLALIDARQADEFGAQLALVLDFQAFLFAIAQATDEDFNYAQMETGLTSILSTEWMREYRELQRRATERLADEPEFFGRCAYIAAHTYSRCNDDITPLALTALLMVPRNLSHHLTQWSINELRAEGGAPPGPGGGFVLNRREDAHASAWRSFVAGWERTFESLSKPVRYGKTAWHDLVRHAPGMRDHLRHSAFLVGRAAWTGDTLAVNWGSDLLLNWITHGERQWDVEPGWWAFQTEELTLELLELDWATVQALPLSSTPQFAPSASATFAGIIRNAWRDFIIAVTGVCLHWMISAGADGAAGRAANALLQHRRHDRGDQGVFPDNRMDMRVVLTALLRINGSGGRFSEQSYAYQFEQFAGELGGLSEEPWVSMRLYTSDGGLGFSHLHVEHALMIMAAGSNAEVQIDQTLRRMVTAVDDETLRRREDYLRRLSGALADEVTSEAHASMFEVLGSPDAGSFNDRLYAAQQLVGAALTTLTEHRLRTIQIAPLDPSRLNNVADAAAAQAFRPVRFPLNHFSAIERTTSALEAFSLRVNNQDKGAFTTPLMAHATSNEERWWRETMLDTVARVVWRDVLQATPFESREGRTPEVFWIAIRDSAAALRSIGQEPVLVVGSTMTPPWLNDWRWREREGRTPKPADLTINRDPNQPDGYEFSMNETPVFRAQTYRGEVYVIPKALLQRVQFHDYDDRRPVAARFENDPADAWRGSIVLEFQRAVELGNLPAFKIIYDSVPLDAPPPQGKA